MVLMTTRLMILFLVVALLVPSAQAADPALPQPPLALVPGTTPALADFFRFRELEMKDARKQVFTLAGKFWELRVPYQGEVETIRAHFRALAQAGGEVLLVDGARGLHFRVDSPAGPVYGKLHVGGSNYALDLVRPAPCPRDLVFGNGVYARAMNSDQPVNPPLITDYPDSRYYAAKEFEFDRLELKLRQGRQAIQKTVEGHYWQKHVEVPPRPDGTVHEDELGEAFRLAALDAGAEILETPDRSVVFHLPSPETGDLWAHVWPQEGKYTLKVVQEAPMRQVLVLEKDEMMARLDALGKLTLRGLFFDTARATLKAESEPALQNAQDLLQSYPDLVLEVGGHTDNVGGSEANQTLSENRAASVRAWLVEHGIPAERLQAVGYGEDRPIATNETEVGRAANRRVELTKLAGGQQRDLVTLIAPYPGSRFRGEEQASAADTHTMFRTGSDGRVQEVEVRGTRVRRNYDVLDEGGQRDKKLSGVQIRSNYRRAVLDLGGEILAERTHGLYFRLKDPSGQETWFEIWAPGSSYTISAVKVSP